MGLFSSLLGDVGGYFSGQDQKHAAKNTISTYNTVGKQATDQFNGANDVTVQRYTPIYNAGVGGLNNAANMLQPGYNFQSSDPSYQWRLDQGLQGVQQSAAANGLLNSGGAMKALNNYAQGAASQEFQNQFNRQNTLAGYAQPAANGLANSEYEKANGITNALFGMAKGVTGGYQGKADALNSQTGALVNGAKDLGSHFFGAGF